MQPYCRISILEQNINTAIFLYYPDSCRLARFVVNFSLLLKNHSVDHDSVEISSLFCEFCAFLWLIISCLFFIQLRYLLQNFNAIEWINNYPRKVIGYKTAEEYFNQELLVA